MHGIDDGLLRSGKNTRSNLCQEKAWRLLLFGMRASAVTLQGRGKFSSKIVNQEVCALQKDIATVGMAQTEHEDRKGAIADL